MTTPARGEQRAEIGIAPVRRGRAYWFPERSSYTSETKPCYLTSEFLVFGLYLMGLGIAAATSPSIVRPPVLDSRDRRGGRIHAQPWDREGRNPKPSPRPARGHRPRSLRVVQTTTSSANAGR
jgi:hypothetical protein